MSTEKSTRRGKNSERDGGKRAFTLDFLVHGSSVPIHSQQPKASSKCKSCHEAPKKQIRKEFSFPMDKIIYLSERLELTKLTEKKIEAMSVSSAEPDFKNSSGESEIEDWTGRNEKNLSSRVSAPVFDFSLDLSCISNIDDESDDNCEPTNKETSPRYRSKSSRNIASKKEVCEKPSELHGQSSAARNCAQYFPDMCDIKAPKISSPVSDSVKVYVKTVNKEKELVRFFRPCCTCNDLSCICPLLSSRGDLFPSENPPERCENNARGESCSFEGLYKLNEGSETQGQLACDCASCFLFEKEVHSPRCCCPETVESDLFLPSCGEECGCRSGSVVSERILAYTSKLASAARSARDLARDLEFILSSLNNESERTRRGDPQ